MHKLSRREALRVTGVAALAAGAAMVPIRTHAESAELNALIETHRVAAKAFLAVVDRDQAGKGVSPRTYHAANDAEEKAVEAIVSYRCRTMDETTIWAKYLLTVPLVVDFWGDEAIELLDSQAEEVRS